MMKWLKDSSGQMTVELVVAFPVLLIVALVAVNALLFFSECASFDRLMREAVRVHASSPAYGQGIDQSIALVQADLDSKFEADYLDVEVNAWAEGAGHTRFSASLFFSPTLFGRSLKAEVFGVSFPRLVHTTSLVVDTYKPGVLL